MKTRSKDDKSLKSDQKDAVTTRPPRAPVKTSFTPKKIFDSIVSKVTGRTQVLDVPLPVEEKKEIKSSINVSDVARDFQKLSITPDKSAKDIANVLTPTLTSDSRDPLLDGTQAYTDSHGVSQAMAKTPPISTLDLLSADASGMLKGIKSELEATPPEHSSSRILDTSDRSSGPRAYGEFRARLSYDDSLDEKEVLDKHSLFSFNIGKSQITTTPKDLSTTVTSLCKGSPGERMYHESHGRAIHGGMLCAVRTVQDIVSQLVSADLLRSAATLHRMINKQDITHVPTQLVEDMRPIPSNEILQSTIPHTQSEMWETLTADNKNHYEAWCNAQTSGLEKKLEDFKSSAKRLERKLQVAQKDNLDLDKESGSQKEIIAARKYILTLITCSLGLFLPAITIIY